eukprot:CAMPEP_0184736240 /NCGR_PEP_ID=MMETSP0314-20130426/62302_1 /TAXON_ID=38298 /ORGANISM="Rhodella maculata, Strain CCMP 736" /LENGTH=215 /DNA_ID=CAMNT_0027203297 /DNA_START=115 /DNA_END=758 /DNA_ORIENTATION=-
MSLFKRLSAIETFSPGLNGGSPRYGQPAQRNASPSEQLPHDDFFGSPSSSIFTFFSSASSSPANPHEQSLHAFLLGFAFPSPLPPTTPHASPPLRSHPSPPPLSTMTSLTLPAHTSDATTIPSLPAFPSLSSLTLPLPSPPSRALASALFAALLPSATLTLLHPADAPAAAFGAALTLAGFAGVATEGGRTTAVKMGFAMGAATELGEDDGGEDG